MSIHPLPGLPASTPFFWGSRPVFRFILWRKQRKPSPPGRRWIFASQIKGYGKAAGRYRVCALCGVGLTPTGGRREEVRKASKAPEDIPLFTLQGGMDRGKLRGMNKLAISMLTKGLQGQDQRSPADEEMLALLTRDDCYVSLENLSEVLNWLRMQ